jgi:hypothetical protein
MQCGCEHLGRDVCDAERTLLVSSVCGQGRSQLAGRRARC